LRLGRISLDGRGRFEQERPPPVCDHLDLRQDLRFLFGREVRLRVGELIELVLELGPELPAPSDVADRSERSNCCIRRSAKSSGCRA
jgi:hypothetical protein